MKILLIDPMRVNLETYLIIPNVGLGYLATALRRAGHEPEICNAARDSLSPEYVARMVAEKRYDVVGVTIFTPYFSSAAAYASAIRNRYPQVYLVAGGPHAIFEPVDVLQKIPEFDYVVTGEGEICFPALLDLLGGAEEPGADQLMKISNLCFRDGDGYSLSRREHIEDIKPLDLPAWDLQEPQKFALYPNGIFTKKKKVAPLITSRGCPYPCKFCGAGIAMGKKMRHRAPDSIIEEMILLRDKYGIHEIQMMDDNFIVDKKFAMEVCEKMIAADLNMVWGCPPGVRVNCIDDEIVGMMARAGCYSTSLGIESGSQRTLNLMNKNLDIKTVPEKIAILKKHNFRITGLFILGFPGETVAEMHETIRFALKLDIDRVNFFTFTPFPGSEMYDELKAQGKLENLDYDELYIHNLGYCHDTIPEKELVRAQRNSHFKFYLRPRIIMGILKEIHSFTQLKIIFLRAMKIIFPRKNR